MFLTLSVSASAWGAEGIYKTALFGASYNSKSISSYTESWSATNDGFTVNLTNANNNSNGWNYIKMGRKDNASTGTITTANAIDKAVTKVTLKIDALTSNKINSITLYTKTSSGSYVSAGTFSKQAGDQTVTISNPSANLFYKIEVVCASGSSNGLITISRVDYYADLTPTATYDVSWVVNGEEIDVTEDINEGSKVPSLPAEPEIDCSGKVFVGWSDQEGLDGEKPAVLFRDVANSPTITKQTTFYAVFAESGGSSVTTWSKTDISAINDGDEVVVVMNNGKNYALYDANGTNSAPTATPISVSNNLIDTPSEGIVWVIGKSGNDLTFYKDDTKKTWLYCTATNDGVRVGTNTNKTFTIDESSGYLKHTGTSRYVGIYNSQDWRCYTGTAGTNIANQTLAFYKKTTTSGYQNYTTSCTTPSEYTVTFNANGHGTAPTPQTVASGQQATEPTPAPTATGYTFGGWYKESECTNEFDFSTSIIDNITLYAQWTCETPVFDIKIKEDNPVVFSGELIELTVVGSNIAADATYQWYKYNGTTYDELTGQKANKLTIAEATANDAGNYKCVVTNGTCFAENNFTVKMYSLRGLTDNNWSTDFVFTKVDATTATYSMELAGNSSYDFKVYDGSVYYGNTGGNPTMTSDNCTNWTMQENTGNNVTLQTTAAGIYTFTLDYTDASNPTISVTYPAKRIVYLNPDVWASDNPKFAVHAWHGSTVEDILMTKIDDCNNRNIYFAEIDAAHTYVIFIRGDRESYNISNPWNNVLNQTGDLTIENVQYNIGSEWNFSKASWTSFTPNYTVTFDENGHGTAPDAQCVAKNGKATTPATPTATGYTFAGWYKEAGCTNVWDFANDVVTSDITLYAKWTANTNTAYTVKHYQENIDGTYPATPTNTDNLTGTTATSVTPAVKDYTGFTAPSTQTVTIAADGSTVVEYKYIRNSYTLAWDLAGGRITQAGTTAGPVKFDAPLTAPTVTKSGLTFIGWNPEVPPTMPAADATYTAIWENCIWVETTTIEDGDEIVFIMMDNKTSTSYAMDNKVTTSSNPLAIEINTDIFSSGNVPNNIIWDIQKDANGIVFYSKTAADNYLRCNAKPNVRVGVGANNTFTLYEGYIKSLSNADSYLAVATGADTKDWRQYGYSSSNITNQTLKFYKRVCLPEGQYWVKWMVNGQEYTEGNPTTMVVAGGQVVTLPTIPDDYQLPGCTSKKFIGWTTDEILVETDDAPTMFTDAASSPAINTNQTFHALFADVEEGEEGWAQVTTTDDLIAGDIYTIGSSSTSGNGKVLGAQQSNNRAAVSWNSGNLVELTLGESTGAWTLSDGTGYLYAASSSSNHLKTQETNNANGTWSINFSTTTPKGSAIIVAQGSNSRNVLRYNVNSGGDPLFSCYKDSEQMAAIYLFKKLPGTIFSGYVTQCCTPWEAPTLSATTSIAVGNNTTITPNSGATYGNVTYSSSDEIIATVYANGMVTGRKPGKATITATWDGVDDDPATNYCEATTTIDITVTGSFTITYDANDALATGTTASTIIEYPDGTGTVATNGFALNGHEFVKWNTKNDGSGTSYNAGDAITLTDDIKLYAIWQPNQYDITVNVVGGSITLGTTTITTANTPQTITDVVAHGQSFSFTNATPDAAYETPYAVTLESGTATVTINSLTISNVQSDLEITIEYTLKPVYTITYIIPEGGGELAADAVTSIYKGGSITLPGIKDGTISSEYSCEEFIGWTTNPANHEAAGLKPEPFYNTGASFSDVSEDVTFYPVYSRPGAGVGGTVTLTAEEMEGWATAQSYGTERELTTCVGTWKTTGVKSTGNPIQLRATDNPYVEFPELQGNITQVVLNATNGSNATLTSGTFTLKTIDGQTITSASVNSSGVCTLTVTGSHKTARLYSSVTARIANISISYGPAAIVSTNLKCTNDFDECTITYDLNESLLPTGTTVYGACADATFSFSEIGTYTICATPIANEHQLLGWNNQCDGKGSINYTPGQVISSLPQNNIVLYAQWAPQVIVHDSYEETFVYPTEAGGSITLNPGTQGCDPKKYDFIGWTDVNPLIGNSTESPWNQTNTPPTLLPTNLDGTVTYTPDGPSEVYAVYAIEDQANSSAFVLSSNVEGVTYYVGYDSNRSGGVRAKNNVADALKFYKEVINAKENKYLIYYVDPDEQDKEYLYYSGSALSTSNDPSNNPSNYGWIFNTSGTGYKFQSIAYSTRYLSITTSNVQTNTTGSVFNMETVAEYQYVAKTNCTDQVTITFVPGNGTMTPSNTTVTAKSGDIITLPECEFNGWTFLGWVTDNVEETERPNVMTIYTDAFEVGNSDITLYAYYTCDPEPVPFDGNTDGVWKIYSEVTSGTYKYANSHTSNNPATLPASDYCPNAEDWTFVNVGEPYKYYIKNEAGKYLTPESNTETGFTFGSTPQIWNIESAGNDQYKIFHNETPDRLIMCGPTAFYNTSNDNINNPAWHLVFIGGCINSVYTTDPQEREAISITGTLQITSAVGQTVKAADKITLTIKNMPSAQVFNISADNLTFYDEENKVITSLQAGNNGSLTAVLSVAYTPIVANKLETPQIKIEYGGKIRSFRNVSARSLPATFAIVAKVGNLWYALPSQGLNSTTPPAAYPVEVDNMADPTAVTAVPANADWSLRQVLNDRFTANGENLVFVNNASPVMALNASSSEKENYLLTDAQYNSYYSTNPGLYEWTPTTTDLETYQLTNEQRSRTLSVNTATVFGVHAQNKAVEQVRFLPIQDRYTPAALQVVEWKENSVVIMYNGDPAQTASVSVNGAAAQNTTLSAPQSQRDIAVYELTADGLAANPTQQLSITIGTEKAILPIPYIISGEKTDLALLPGSTVAARQDIAKVSDLVILKGATLTAAGAKGNPYKFRNVTVYGGGKLVVPADNGFGVASLTLRAGGITDAGEYDYVYDYVYPQFDLRGTFTNSAAKINYDYITDYDHWFHLVLPFAGDLGTIKYPTEFYGANVAANNTGSWQIKRYAGEIRAIGNYDAWVDIETEDKTSTTAGQGYIFWGAPKKVSVNGGASTRQKWGIQRITMSVTAPNAMTAENGDKAITGLSSHEDVPNNSGKDNDQGWNLIGNPYMVNLTDMATTGLHACKLVEVIDPATGKWNGQWEWNDETSIRYLTIPSEHFDTYTAKTVAQSVPLVPGRAFFVQLEGEANGITFAAANRASLMPALLAENSDKPVDIETGIVLSNETLQDEVNFWIKDGKTNDYEYNADYPKTPNNNHFNIYGVHINGDLSWVATGPEYAAESMPIGYQVPAAGTYTLSVSETYYSEDLQALYVTDHAMSPELTVDLMSAPYEFSVNQAETNNERFTISLILKSENQGPTTGWENIDVGKDQSIKFIYLDQLYILRNGIIYDATGQQIQTINK